MTNSQQPTAVLSEQTINQRNLEVLQKHFPQAIEVDADGRFIINSTKLQLSLDPAGVKVEEDGYEMRWVGKRDAYHNAFLPTQKILNPLPQDSKNWDTTANLLLRGDNIEALRLLRHSYFGAIKLIYIDPPYNTKSDGFIYNDNFSTNQTQVLAALGYDAENIDYIKNIYGAKTHSGWLSFMYPRLLLAKDLLRDDGVIFISIDDNEQAQLKMLCDEVFGEHNFVASVIWEKIHSTKNDAKHLSDNHEYILLYAKNIDIVEVGLLPRTEEMNARFTNLDNDERGAWSSGDLIANEERKEGYFPVEGPTGLIFNVPNGKHWVYSQENLERMKLENRLYFGVNGTAFPRLKRFLSDVQQGKKADTIWTTPEVGSNQTAKREIKKIFSDLALFETPKPVDLISRMLTMFCKKAKDDIILDYFAGSGTTGEAVMRLNAEDGGNRKFILVQIPQAIDPKEQKEAHRFVSEELGKPATIFEITAERLRRAGASIEAKQAAELAYNKPVDTGFRVFDIIEDTNALILQKPLSAVTQDDLDLFIEDSFIEQEKPSGNGGAGDDNVEDLSTKTSQVLYNLLLAEGLPLSIVPVEVIPQKLYLAQNVAIILSAIDLAVLKSTLENLKNTATPATYLTVYAPWVHDDNFMQGIKTLAESLGYSSDKLRLRGFGF